MRRPPPSSRGCSDPAASSACCGTCGTTRVSWVADAGRTSSAARTRRRMVAERHQTSRTRFGTEAIREFVHDVERRPAPRTMAVDAEGLPTWCRRTRYVRLSPRRRRAGTPRSASCSPPTPDRPGARPSSCRTVTAAYRAVRTGRLRSPRWPGQVFFSNTSRRPCRVRSGSVHGHGRRLGDDDRRETAGGDDRRDLADLGDDARRRSRRPGRRTRRARRTAAPRRCSCRSPSAARRTRPCAAGRRARRARRGRSRCPGRARRRGTRPRPTTTSKFVDGAEVDDDARAAVERVRRQRVDDAVGADLLGVVHEHRHAGARAGLDDHVRHVGRSSARAWSASRAAPRAPSSRARRR